jgi:imidazole glycerol-phosphate synthase subunit HisH
MIGIVDYGMGNLGSVKRKFDKVNAYPIISGDPATLEKCEKLVLPGVGHFSTAVKELKERGLWDYLNKDVLINKKPILGICLGMQLMAKRSEEGNVEGLGWFDADVVRFNIKDHLRFKIPHMGWKNAIPQKESLLLKNIGADAMFYFVHSYHIVCHNEADILTTSEYEYAFTSAIEKDNIFGTQFHPEKSHDTGEQLYKNFAEL